MLRTSNNLVHLSDQSVDLVFPISEITTLHEMSELSCTESTGWVAELEWPQEVGSLLEVGTNGEDLVDQVLHADNAVLAKAVFNNGVIGKSNSLLVDLSISALVDELAGGLKVRISVRDPWLDNFEHLESGLGHANKDTIVDLKKAEKLEDLARLGCDLVDTLDTDNEDQLVLSWNVVGTILLCKAGETNLLTLLISVLLNVLLGTLEDDTALLLLSLLFLLKFSRSLFTGLLLTLALFQESLRNKNLVMCGHASVSG